MSILVDSDYVIDGIGGKKEVIGILTSRGLSGLAVSTVTLGEVFEGAYRSPHPAARLARYRLFLAGFAVLPVTEAVAESFAQLRADLRGQGNIIPDLDLLIAATAIAHDLELLTRNSRHFARVPGLRLHRPT